MKKRPMGPRCTCAISLVIVRCCSSKGWPSFPNLEDLSTGLAAPVADGGLGLEGWQAGIGADEVAKPGETGKEIVGIISENSSVSLDISLSISKCYDFC